MELTTGSAEARPGSGATRVRFGVLTFGLFAAAITYLDRICISAAAPSITAELDLSDVEMGYVFSVFALAYGVFEIPTGWMSDQIGQRKALTRIVACWSLFTMLSGAARGFYSLFITRALFGAAEAGAFPTLAGMVSRWFPARDLGKAQGAIWMAARIGGAIAPPITAYLILRFGWRASFYILGLAGLAWCVGFWPWYRDEPRDHPGANAAEARYIEESRAVATADSARPVPWMALLSSGNMWALFWMYFTTGYGFWFFLTWMPTYLIREHGLSLETSGLYSAAPLAAGAVTSLAGGSLSDWLAVRLGSIVWGRRIVGVTAFVIAAAGFGFATQATTPGSAVALFAMSQGALDLAVPVAWATCSSVGGRYGGTATGFMNSASSVSAFVSPISGAWLSQRYGSFRPMFIVSMAIYLVGALLWFRIDPTDTIDKEQHG